MNSRPAKETLGEFARSDEGEDLAPDSENRLRQILDNINDIVVCYSAAGQCLYASPSYERIFGRAPSELYRARGLDFVHPEDRQGMIDALKMLRSRDSVVVRYRAIPRDGVTRWFEATIRSLRRNESGHIAETVSVSRDITKQVEAEEALSASEYEFRRLLDNVTDVVHRFDGKMICLYVSPSIKRVLGLDPSEVVGHAMDPSEVHPEDHDVVTSAFRRILATREPETFTSRVLHRGSGRFVWLETTMRAMAWHADGRIAEILAVSRDVTSRKEVADMLEGALRHAEAASAAKSRFLANMSHELRTPLNAVLGFSDIIRQELLGPLIPVRYKDYVELIHKSGSHLLDLINDVLDMSRVEAGKVNLRIEAVDLRELIDHCLKLVEVRAENGGLTLRTTIEDTLPAIHADRRAVFQIILNLLTNAIKFTPRGGCVTVCASRHADGVELRLEDTGVGIAPEDLSRLTIPFEQAVQDPHLAHAGTGLGLALVHSLIDLHGGVLKIESKLGQGTIVTVFLPARRSHDPQLEHCGTA